MLVRKTTVGDLFYKKLIAGENPFEGSRGFEVLFWYQGQYQAFNNGRDDPIAGFIYNVAVFYAGGEILGGVFAWGRGLFFETEAVGVGRVFWSGGNIAKNGAMEFAEKYGMKTLEMTPKGRIMNAVSPYLPRSIANPIWNSLSRSLAEGATGEVNFFTTTFGPKPTSIWTTIEKPILEENGVSIIKHLVN